MTKSTITRERLAKIKSWRETYGAGSNVMLPAEEAEELACLALAAMDSESGCLPLDYLQGHKDGLEWAAQLAEANHPETGDWLYDDPIELAKAIRKGPDMPPAQPAADSEPVIIVGDDGGDALSYRRLIQSFEPGTKLYRHAQPAPVVPDDLAKAFISAIEKEQDRLFGEDYLMDSKDCIDVIREEAQRWNACRAAMLQASPVCTCPSGDGSLRWPCPVHPGNSPIIGIDLASVQDRTVEVRYVAPPGYVMVPMRLTAENGAKGALSGEFSETKFVNCPECFGDDECETCDGSGRIEITVPVTWSAIKDIWAKGVEHFAAAPQEVR